MIGNSPSNLVWAILDQASDSNLTSNVWFQWDLNLAEATNVGIPVWTDINYFSIKINEVANATDFNFFVDEIVVTPTQQVLYQYNFETRLCVDLDNDPAGCYDLNWFSPIRFNVDTLDTNNIWVWLDANLHGLPFDFIFDFDLNFSFGSDAFAS